MGGDAAPAVQVQGALLARAAGVQVVLVGDQALVRPLLPEGHGLGLRHCADWIRPEEPPAASLRQRPATSVRVAARMVGVGEASAMVGFGNTGATMVGALFELGRMPGIDRPAVLGTVPRADGGRLVVVDLGANVGAKPAHLAEFAAMGVAFSQAVLGVGDPRVGLLSNGTEAQKGTESIRAAQALIAQMPVTFVGQVEPTGALGGAVDVLVADGFSGNLLLKTMEATAELLVQMLARSTDAQAGQAAVAELKARAHYGRVGGALLAGVRGVAVVGHGRSDPQTVCNALQLAQRCVDRGVLARLGAALGG